MQRLMSTLSHSFLLVQVNVLKYVITGNVSLILPPVHCVWQWHVMLAVQQRSISGLKSAWLYFSRQLYAHQ